MARLSRRELLAGTASAGLAAALGRLPRTRGPVVWVSDTHVSIRGNLEENRFMFREIRQKHRPRLIVNGGDVTDYGWEEEYARYRELLAIMGAPAAHVPGNHDVRWSPLGPDAFTKTCGSEFRRVDAGSFTLFLLDTTVPLSHWGSIGSLQLRWLESQLKHLRPEHPIVLGMHHWVGRPQVMVDDEEELRRILEGRNVKLILTGHGHSDLRWEWDGITCIMCKGLYQGSYMVLDESEDGITLMRRTADRPTAIPEAFIPWAPSSVDRPRFPAATLSLSEYQVLDRQEKPDLSKAVPGFQVVQWSEAGHLSRSLVEIAARPDDLVEMVWERKLPGGVINRVAESEGLIFTADLPGALTAVDAETGRTQWGGAVLGWCFASPKIEGDRVWAASSAGRLVCFERQTGRVALEIQAGAPIYTTPVVTGGRVVAACGDQTIRAWDVQTGREIWRTRVAGPLTAAKNPNTFIQSGLATDGKLVFAGAWDNTVYAFSAETGDIVWNQGVCEEMSFHYSPAIGAPLLVGDSVIVPANGNRLVSLEAGTGRERWRQTTPDDKFGYSGALPGFPGQILIGCLGDKGAFRCLEASSGRILWSCETGRGIYDSSPVMVQGHAAVVSTNGLVTLASLKTGEITGRWQAAPGVGLSTCAVRGDRLYVATNNARLTCLRVRRPA